MALGAAGIVWESFGFGAARQACGLGAVAAVKYNDSFLEAGQIF
jgi:hypothetical protein